MRRLLFVVLLCVSILAQAQISIVRLILDNNGAYKIEFINNKPSFSSKDSIVFYNVIDDQKVDIIIRDTLNKTRALKVSLVLRPYSKTLITIARNKRRLKVLDRKIVYFQPPKRCKGTTTTAEVERKIVDLMMIENTYPRMRDAKKFIREHCLKFRQIQGLIMMFDSDKDRLDLAEYAYFFVRDPYNYFLMKDAFANKKTYRDFEFFVRSVKRNF